jgi:hypothetical protein
MRDKQSEGYEDALLEVRYAEQEAAQEEDYELPVFCQICGAKDGDRTLAGGTVEVEDDLCLLCREERPGRRRPLPSYMNEDGDDSGIPF